MIRMQGRFEQEDVKPYLGRTLKICGMDFTLFEYREPMLKPKIAWLHVIESGDVLIFATPYVNDIIPLCVYVVYREDGKSIVDETKMGRKYYDKKIETITEYCEAVKMLSEHVIKDYVERTEKLNTELTVTRDGRRF
jgi:hypothetical protein